MTGFEPQTSGIGSNCSTNWATQLQPFLSQAEAALLRRREEVEARKQKVERFPSNLGQFFYKIIYFGFPDTFINNPSFINH